MLKVKRIPMPFIFSRYGAHVFHTKGQQVTSTYKRRTGSLLQLPMARVHVVPKNVETNFVQRCTFCKQTSQNMQNAPESSASSSSSSVPPPPTPPRLPDRQQLEKYAFRTIAFVWDVSQFVYLWLLQKFHVHVAQHPTVRQYWHTFLDKLEKSRRD